MRSTILANAAKYFNNERNTLDQWFTKYRKAEANIHHDEPWLTLYALYSLFWTQSDLNAPNRIEAFNELLSRSGMNTHPKVDEINSVQVEKMVSEINEYKTYLYNECLDKGNYHLYPDRISILNDRLAGRNASLEGNTNVDILITAKSSESTLCFFVEAKYLSDISCQITYNPVRDQIIRNIDAGISFAKDNKIDCRDFYFILLTPKIFRISEYGGNRSSSIEPFCPNKSRFYCYKMQEYKNYQQVRQCLPHRKELDEKTWRSISNHIGWITFEDIINIALQHNTIKAAEREHIFSFFEERNLVQQ